MRDPFSGRVTCIQGAHIPSAADLAEIANGHRRRLQASNRLVRAAAQCGFGEDKERDFVRFRENELVLLERGGTDWANFGKAIREFRKLVPIVPLQSFGFPVAIDDRFDMVSSQLRDAGVGFEALVFLGEDGSIYKFFPFRDDSEIGVTFDFQVAQSNQLIATAVPGSYRQLFAKIRIIHDFGMPTEVVGITPEGIIIAKQTVGSPIEPDTNLDSLEAGRLISIPSAFLSADRCQPRLAFVDGSPWLVADTHSRNVVRDSSGTLRIIDLVAAPIPHELISRCAPFRNWVARVKEDPFSAPLDDVPDSEL